MSIAAAKHFLDKVYTDQALMSEFESYRNRSEEERLQLSLNKGRQLGFDFSAQEFLEVNAIKSFWKKVGEDASLQASLEAEANSPAEDVVSKVVYLADQAGFKFSKENMVALSQLQLAEDVDDELTEDELAHVAGGAVNVSAGVGSAASLVTRLASPRRPGGINSASTIMCPW